MIWLLNPAPIEMDYRPGTGLSVRQNGVTLVRGSFFQAYAPGWTEGYYSSNWNPQTVTKRPDGSLLVTFSHELLEGQIEYSVSGETLTQKHRYLWKHTKPAHLESSVGHVWGEPFGDPSLQPSLRFEGKLGTLNIASGSPLVALDGRTNDNDWAMRSPVWWVGWPALELTPGQETRVEATLSLRTQVPTATRIPPPIFATKRAPLLVPAPEHPALRKVKKPALKWRGVHLFVGPQSRAIHERFARDVFPKLGINKVVLQCERTAWDCLPGTATGITMSKADLAAIFRAYRKNGIEPIPLIQSWGHMEWLFANDRNPNLAYVKDGVYAMDIRKPEARAKLREIWKEAVALLKPKVIHFGLDEVQMRELPKDSPLVTSMWKDFLPWLGGLAAELKCESMIWGDIALSEGEAPDATSYEKGVGPERRAAIPKGAWIADWHYLNDPNPAKYPSLKLFQQSGHRPIAATWYSPNNIYGFTHAALQTGSAGVLHTNWQGYAINEASLREAFDKYAAMVLTAYYARTGDKTRPEKLGWSPIDAFRELVFEPLPTKPVVGQFSWVGQPDVVKGRGMEFVVGEPVSFMDALKGSSGPVVLPIPASRYVAVRCEHRLAPGELVGTIGGVKLIYGQNIVAASDPQPPTSGRRLGDWCIVPVSQADRELRQLNPAAGLVFGGSARR